MIESSRGATNEAYRGMHFDRALKAPIKEHMDVQVVGGDTVISGEVLCLHGVSVPAFHFQPKMVVSKGQIQVFEAERAILFCTDC